MSPAKAAPLPQTELGTRILNMLDGGIVLLDRMGRVRFWNSWMERFSGRTAADMIGRDLVIALPSIVDTRLHGAIRDTLATGAPALLSHTLNPVLFPLTLADGRRLIHNAQIRRLDLWGLDSGDPDGDGDDCSGCLIQIVDVTAMVNRERVLREQRDARYRAIVDTAPDAIVTTDMRGVVQWVNGAAARQFGYSAGELAGQSVRLFLVEGSGFWSELASRTVGDGPPPTTEVTGRRRDGGQIGLELSIMRWQSEGRSFITGILRDISERHRSREALKDNAQAMTRLAEQTKATLDALPAHIAVLDHQGRIQSVNKAWNAASPGAGYLGAGTGVGDDYLLASTLSCDPGSPAEAVINGLRELMSGGPPLSVEYPGYAEPAVYQRGASGPFAHNPKASGAGSGDDSTDNTRWFRCLAAPMGGGQHGGAVLMHIDVTLIKSMEAALRKAVGQKSVLLREVNHRVKNSLQLVSSLLTLQTMTLTSTQEREHFLDARARIDAIARVHGRLYQSDQFQTIEFGAYLGEMCSDLTRAAGDDLVEIRTTLDQVNLPIDMAAPLGLIANELITNAIKHRGTGRARLRIDLRESNRQVTLTIADDGPGLPRGFDIRSQRTLGMWLITSLSAQIGGQAQVVPTKAGTCFQVTATYDPDEPLHDFDSDGPLKNAHPVSGTAELRR